MTAVEHKYEETFMPVPQGAGLGRAGEGQHGSNAKENAKLMALEMDNIRLQRLVGELLVKNQELREAANKLKLIVDMAGLSTALAVGED